MMTPTVIEQHRLSAHLATKCPKVSMPDRVRASLIAVPEPKAPR